MHLCLQALGIIDSSLPTVAVFAKSTPEPEKPSTDSSKFVIYICYLFIDKIANLHVCVCALTGGIVLMFNNWRKRSEF